LLSANAHHPLDESLLLVMAEECEVKDYLNNKNNFTWKPSSVDGKLGLPVQKKHKSLKMP
jgi:hypothetical protein